MNDFILDPIVDFGEDALNVGEDILNTINPANWSKFHVLASGCWKNTNWKYWSMNDSWFRKHS